MPDDPTWLDIDDFKKRARAGDAPDQPATVKSFGVQRAIDQEARTIRYVMSTGDIDRHHDTIDQSGWELPADAPALWHHDHRTPAIGRWINMTTSPDLEGDLAFTRAGVDPFSDMLWNLAVAGVVKTCSVGFLPKEWVWVEDDDRPWGIDFKRQELLECSLVNVPANASAVQLAKAKGIDMRPLADWAERLLDDYHQTGGGIWINRVDLDALRKAAAGSSKAQPAQPKAIDPLPQHDQVADVDDEEAEVREQEIREAEIRLHRVLST